MTTTRLRPTAGLLVLAFATALIAAFATPAGAASTATSCKIASVAHKLGPTTVTSLRVTNVSCAAGITIVKAFHSCRLAHGKSGRCVKLVKGYACQEQRQNAPTQFTATVTCRNGKASVTHRYIQNL